MASVPFVNRTLVTIQKLVDVLKTTNVLSFGGFTVSLSSSQKDQVIRTFLSIVNLMLALRDGAPLDTIISNIMSVISQIISPSQILERLSKMVKKFVEDILDILRSFKSGWDSQSLASTFNAVLLNCWADVKDRYSTIDDISRDYVWTVAQQFLDKMIAIWSAYQQGFEIDDINFENLSKLREKIAPVSKLTFDIVDMTMDGLKLVTSNFDSIMKGDFSWCLLGKGEARELEDAIALIQGMNSLVVTNQWNTLKEEYKHTPESFDIFVRDTEAQCVKHLSISTGLAQRAILGRYLKDLRIVKASRTLAISQDMTKLEPFGLLMYGGSGVGKSFVQDALAKVIMQGAGLKPDSRVIVSANIMEKFDSRVNTDTQIIIGDDVGNGESREDCSERIIGWVNTQRRSILKAGVDEKDKHSYDNKGCIISTNDHTLKNAVKSVKPTSVFRRFPIHINVRVKEQFRRIASQEDSPIDKSKVKDLSERDKLDIYEFQVFRFIDMVDDVPVDICLEMTNSGKAEIVDGIFLMERLEIPDGKAPVLERLRSFLYQIVKTHFAQQFHNVEQMKKLATEDICQSCGMGGTYCECFDNQVDISILTNTYSQVVDYSLYSRDVLLRKHEELSRACSSVGDFINFWKALSLMFVKRNDLFREFILSSWKFFFLFAWFIVATHMSYNIGFFPMYLINIMCTFILPFACSLRFVKYQLHVCRQEVCARRGMLAYVTDSLESVRFDHAKEVFLGLGIIFTFYNLYRLFRSESFEQQDVNVNSAIPSEEFTYTKDERNKPPSMSWKARTTTGGNLSEILQSQLVVMRSSNGARCNALPIIDNTFLVPNHALPADGDYDLEFYPNGVGNWSGKSRVPRVSELDISRIPGKDYALVRVVNAAPSRNLLCFFPNNELDSHGRICTHIFKSPDGDIEMSDNYVSPYHSFIKRKAGLNKIVTKQNVILTSPLVVDMSKPTFAGLCGSVVIDKSFGAILGFHAAGSGKRAILSPITRSEIELALKKFGDRFIPSSQTDIDVGEKFGYSLVDGDIHIGYQDADSSVNLDPLKHTCINRGLVYKDGVQYGSTPTVPFQKSEFLPAIVEEFGENTHCPPQGIKSMFHSRKAFTDYNTPKDNFSSTEVDLAVSDYLSDILASIEEMKVKKPEEFADIRRMLSFQEALDGIGEKGYNGLNNSSSIGFPCSGKKIKYMELDPDDRTLPKIPREFKEEEYPIHANIEHMKACALAKERFNVCVKTCTKTNELLPKEKFKARPFQAMGTDFLVLCRQTFAPFVRFLSRNRELTECMMGINVHSKDWGDLREYLTTFDEDSCIAGDFKAYDRNMSSQITNGVAEVILKILDAFEVSEEHRLIAEGLLTEVLYPHVLFYGQLVTLANSNISGWFLTTQMNSVANSLMLRIVYNRLYPRNRDSFRSKVKLATFGDDNAMNVHRSRPKFNHTDIARIFKDVYGITYTMDVKDADSVPYQHVDELGFLKRKFRFDPDYNAIVGCIEETSLTKSLHWQKKPSDCPESFETQYMSKVDSALKDASYFGRDRYNEFRDKFIRIASKYPSLQFQKFLTFDEMVARNYAFFHTDQSSILYVEDNEIFDSQSGKDLAFMAGSLSKQSVNALINISRFVSVNAVNNLLRVYFPTYPLSGNVRTIVSFALNAQERLTILRRLLSYYPAVDAGRLEVTPYSSRVQYLEEVEAAILQCELSMSWVPVQSYSSYSRIYTDLCNMQVSMRMNTSTGTLRESPFVVNLYGPTGIGKTGLAMMLATHILKVNDLTVSGQNVVVLNETDEFQSEYKSDIPAVIFDDIANAKSTCNDTINPVRKLIDFANNIEKKALNPNLALKGNVSIRPKVIITTTNSKLMEATQWSNATMSVYRRFDLNLQVSVLDKYVVEGSKVDWKKVRNPFDMWNFVIRKIGSMDGFEGSIDKVSKEAEKDPRYNLKEILSECTMMSKLHFARQKQFLSSLSEVLEAPLCDHDISSSLCEECEVFDSQSGMDDIVEDTLLTVPPNSFNSVFVPFDPLFRGPIANTKIYCLTSLNGYDVPLINLLISQGYFVCIRGYPPFYNRRMSKFSPVAFCDGKWGYFIRESFNSQAGQDVAVPDSMVTSLKLIKEIVQSISQHSHVSRACEDDVLSLFSLHPDVGCLSSPVGTVTSFHDPDDDAKSSSGINAFILGDNDRKFIDYVYSSRKLRFLPELLHGFPLYNKEALLMNYIISSLPYTLVAYEWKIDLTSPCGDMIFRSSSIYFIVETKMHSPKKCFEQAKRSFELFDAFFKPKSLYGFAVTPTGVQQIHESSSNDSVKFKTILDDVLVFFNSLSL